MNKVRNIMYTALVLLSIFSLGIVGKVYVKANVDVQPLEYCVNCDKMTITQCLKQDTYSETVNCKKSSSCKIKIYKSRSARQCRTCGRYWEYYGEHECAEVHTKCGKGRVNICPIGYWPPNCTKNQEEDSGK